MKWHYDPDKFLYDSHSFCLPPDFHILCKMSVYLRFLCGAVFSFVFHCDIGMPPVSFSVLQVAKFIETTSSCGIYFVLHKLSNVVQYAESKRGLQSYGPKVTGVLEFRYVLHFKDVLKITARHDLINYIYVTLHKKLTCLWQVHPSFNIGADHPCVCLTVACPTNGQRGWFVFMGSLFNPLLNEFRNCWCATFLQKKLW